MPPKPKSNIKSVGAVVGGATVLGAAAAVGAGRHIMKRNALQRAFDNVREKLPVLGKGLLGTFIILLSVGAAGIIPQMQGKATNKARLAWTKPAHWKKLEAWKRIGINAGTITAGGLAGSFLYWALIVHLTKAMGVRTDVSVLLGVITSIGAATAINRLVMTEYGAKGKDNAIEWGLSAGGSFGSIGVAFGLNLARELLFG
jgi:hypothetical protein